MSDLGASTGVHHPDFSPERDVALCSELKQLYVCVTRAKQELYIFDEDEKVNHILLYSVAHLVFKDTPAST
jgi:hypothetical protein